MATIDVMVLGYLRHEQEARRAELLEEEPDEIRKGKSSDVYWYDDVEIDGKYYRIGIAISKTNPGRIVTIYEKWIH